MVRMVMLVAVLLIFTVAVCWMARTPSELLSHPTTGTATVTASVEINQAMTGQYENRIFTFTLPAAKSLQLRTPPAFEVRSESGEVAHTGAFEFG